MGDAAHLAAANPQLAAGLLTFTGVVLGFGVNAYLQFRTDRRKHRYEREMDEWRRRQELRLVRISTTAELTRIAKTILGQYEHMADGNHFMWIPVFGSALPTPETIARAQHLTAAEIEALTAFQYSYQQHVGYLAGAAEKDLASTMDIGVKAIGYNYNEERRRDWLRWSLGVIERKALRALDALHAASAPAADREWTVLKESAAPHERFDPPRRIDFGPRQGRGWVVDGRRRFDLPPAFGIALHAREGGR